MTGATFFRTAWEWNVPVVIGCCGLLIVYAWAVRFRFSLKSVAGFIGILLILVAMVSPLHELGNRYLFSVHMAAHILFVLVIPALLLIGLPPDAVERALRRRSVAAVEHRLNTPAICWIAAVGAMAFWHVPAVFNAAMASEPLHMLESLSLLICGGMFWWPILTPLPRLRMRPVPDAAVYLFSACLGCTCIGITITFAPRLLYAGFAQPADPYGILPMIRSDWGISAALDQQIGGLLMWVPGCLIYLTAILAMFARWYGEESETGIEAQWT